MKRCIRPTVENLETRNCPSTGGITASVQGGTLMINATAATANLSITETGSGAFSVQENGNNVGAGTFSGVSNLNLHLSNQNNSGLLINLGGFSTLDNVFASLGNGYNDLTIENGGMSGALTVIGGRHADQVTLGDGSNSFVIGGITNINLGTSGANVFTVNDAVDLKNDVNVTRAQTVGFEGGSEVVGQLVIGGGSAAISVYINGQMDHSVVVNGTQQADQFTLDSAGSVFDNVILNLGGGADVVSIQGTINNNLTIHGTGSSKDVTLDGSVGNNANISLGAGSNTLDVGATIGSRLTIHTGSGADNLTFESTASMKNANVHLGGGHATFTLNSGVTVTGEANIYGSRKATFVNAYGSLPSNIKVHNFGTTTA